MKNPYQKLHQEFVDAGAKVLLSSGQACVMYGIAAFSKDGDWIIEENNDSIHAVLSVLERKGADYRLGVPLGIRFLSQGWTSHFEYHTDSIRMRIDFCSRPPRIRVPEQLWKNAIHISDIDIVDAESLILLKQTRRVRDYSIIGALAEALGFNADIPEIALDYLQDYEMLKKAVCRWPKQAQQSDREAVRLLISGGDRKKVVIALAVEQDRKIQEDGLRISRMIESSRDYQETFVQLKKEWKEKGLALPQQHAQLIMAAERHLVSL
jgi:hypothetical protein